MNPTNRQIKEAFGYTLSVARQGKLQANASEMENILQNLTVAKDVLQSIPKDEEVAVIDSDEVISDD